jgi:flagellar basal-body rod modification protein FlgD
MVEDSSNIGKTALLRSADTTSQSSSTTASGSTKDIGKDEFLMMLVTQLKNQDPMDPMKGDQFAVNLAQFSQLEQLMKINEKLTSGQQSDSNSMSSYLGHEVTLNSSEIQVKNNDGGRVRFNLQGDATDVKVQLLNADGSVAETIDAGAMTSGRHSVALNSLQTASGNYQVRIEAQGAAGTEEPTGYAAGMVTGFAPGTDPVLLLGDREVKPSEVIEVNVAS